MKIEIKPTAIVEFKVVIELTENEARAWDAIVGYGWEAFEKIFKEHLGKHYMQPYTADAKRMFETTSRDMGYQFHAIEEVRKTMKNISNKDYIKEKS